MSSSSHDNQMYKICHLYDNSVTYYVLYDNLYVVYGSSRLGAHTSGTQGWYVTGTCSTVVRDRHVLNSPTQAWPGIPASIGFGSSKISKARNEKLEVRREQSRLSVSTAADRQYSSRAQKNHILCYFQFDCTYSSAVVYGVCKDLGVECVNDV